MSDLNFDQSGCEPARGPRAVVVTARRGLRVLLRPMFARLVEILASVVARLDRAEALVGVTLEKIDAGGARLDAAETRLDAAERSGAILDTRTHGLAAHLAGLNEEHFALHADVHGPRGALARVAAAETEIHAGKTRLDRAEVLTDLGLKKIDAGGARLDTAEARLDTAEARLDTAEARLDAAERADSVLDARTHGLAAHLAGLNDEHLALHAGVREIAPRLSAAEARLDSFDWHAAVLHPRTEGLAAHLAGLSDDFRALNAEVQARIVQVTALSGTISDLGRRQDELDEKIQAVHALHWDHVALARRLAAIEDLLVARPAVDGGDARPSLPFPGLDDGEARSRVG